MLKQLNGKVMLVMLCGVLSITACHSKNEQRINPVDEFKKNLSFTCVLEAEHIPPRNPEADQLYKHARWLIKGNALKEDAAVWPKAERLIRIASAWQHDKASLELRTMIDAGHAYSPDIMGESVFLVKRDMARGIPGAYYDMARYLEQGYGVQQDQLLALQYYRKAADLGSPEAQYYVGDLLMNGELNGRRQAIENIGVQMKRCAGQQGHGQAALEYAIHMQVDGNYEEALQAFQWGTMAGHGTAAYLLKIGFAVTDPEDEAYIGIKKADNERKKRYEVIRKMLSDYDYLNPKVPEIDQIVPLPPAKLPAWDGNLQWLEAHKANVPPPLPSEARIAQMAQEKGLDPATGWPAKK